MKNIVLTLIMFLPSLLCAQSHFELTDIHATEEHPGIPSSPVTYRVVYYFIAQEDNITVEALTSDGVEDKIIASKVLNKGDKLALQYVTYTYIQTPEWESDLSDEPFFVDVEDGIISLVFPDYNLDRMKTTTSFPVYFVDGKRHEFELPVVDADDVERIYYP